MKYIRRAVRIILPYVIAIAILFCGWYALFLTKKFSQVNSDVTEIQSNVSSMVSFIGDSGTMYPWNMFGADDEVYTVSEDDYIEDEFRELINNYALAWLGTRISFDESASLRMRWHNENNETYCYLRDLPCTTDMGDSVTVSLVLKNWFVISVSFDNIEPAVSQNRGSVATINRYFSEAGFNVEDEELYLSEYPYLDGSYAMKSENPILRTVGAIISDNYVNLDMKYRIIALVSSYEHYTIELDDTVYLSLYGPPSLIFEYSKSLDTVVGFTLRGYD